MKTSKLLSAILRNYMFEPGDLGYNGTSCCKDLMILIWSDGAPDADQIIVVSFADVKPPRACVMRNPLLKIRDFKKISDLLSQDQHQSLLSPV